MINDAEEPRVSKHRRTISLEIAFTRGRQDPERGIFVGDVPDPDFLDELSIDVAPDVAYREATDDFGPTGKTQIHLRGSRRAYVELARYLLALTELDTLDPDYHDHFDDLVDTHGDPTVHLIVHAPPRDSTSV